MNISYRPANRDDSKELMFIAEQDTKIPLLYDSEYTWSDQSIVARLEFYKQQISSEDFFDIAVKENEIVALHIVKKIPYPPNLFAGIIITLWVDPTLRGKGIGTEIKGRAERWAKSIGLDHLQTGVHSNNSQMLSINERNGFKIFQYTLRKKL